MSSRLLFFTKEIPAQIYHLSDKEGGISFFRYIKQSNLVSFDEKIGLDFKNKEVNSYFVYCGDVTDHGPYDLQITRLLIDFKKRYPDRVILIAGNREITKNRFKIELDPQFIRERLLNTSSPRWLKTPTIPMEYVLKKMPGEHDVNAIKKYVDSLSISACQLIYLHWMLEKTMGCSDTFEYRRAELARINGVTTISDEQVLQSMLDESLTAEYLQLTQVAALIPGTRVIAMHGGLNANNIGRLPTMTDDEPPIANIASWIDQYNQWYKQQIDAWMTLKVTHLTEPAFTKLDDISLPLLNKPRSIMVSTVLNKNGEYENVSAAVSDYLNKNNIHAVLTGHQQCGDFPVVLRANNSVIINSDTGCDPCNHQAVSSIEITATNKQTDVTISGVLMNNVSASTQLKISQQGIEGDPYIGKIVDDHRVVQCRLEDGNYRLLFLQAPKTIDHSIVSAQELYEKEVRPLRRQGGSDFC